MKINETIGIDVSKRVVDVFIHSTKSHKVFKNNRFIALLQWISSNSDFKESEQPNRPLYVGNMFDFIIILSNSH